MKVKSLICLALLSAVNVQAFGLEIYKGHIVSHKEWSTGNAKGTFITGNITNQSLKLTPPAKINSDGDYVNIYSHINSSSAKAGALATITGDGMVFIRNSSQASKQYGYQYSVCGLIADKTEQCLYTFDEIQLDADGYFQDSRQPQLQLTFATPGNYQIFASTMVLIEHGATSYMTSMSDGVIIVS